MSKKISNWFETLSLLSLLGVLIYLMRSHFFTGNSIFAHDNRNWDYPIFHYFVESLKQGVIPWWNYYDHGGEPFYLVFAQIRLLDPLTLLHIGVGRIFTDNPIILFNWHRFLQGAWMQLGAYLLFRPLITSLGGRCLFQCFLFLSTSIAAGFCESGAIHLFMWVPYIAILLFRLMEGDHRWRNWIWLAILVGMNWQSYFFSATWLFLCFLLVGVLLFRRDYLKTLIAGPGLIPKALVSGAILGAMAMPNFLLLREQRHYVYPARAVPNNAAQMRPMGRPLGVYSPDLEVNNEAILPYAILALTGTTAGLSDYLSIPAFPVDRYITPLREKLVRDWGSLHKQRSYFGVLGWLFLMVGIFLCTERRKRIFLTLLVLFIWISLGPKGGLHPILYPVLPSLWFFRHTWHLFPFVEFLVSYFVALGIQGSLSWMWDRKRVTASRLSGISAILLTAAFTTCVAVPQIFRYRELHSRTVLVLACSGFLTLFVSAFGRIYVPMMVTGCFLSWYLAYAIHPEPTILQWITMGGLPFLAVWLVMRFLRSSKLATALIPAVLIAFFIPDLLQAFDVNWSLYNTGKRLIVEPLSIPRTPERRLSLAEFERGNTVRHVALLAQSPSAVFPIQKSEKPVTMVKDLRVADSLFLPKLHDDVFRAGISMKQFESIMGVGKPPFSFHTSATQSDREDLAQVIKADADGVPALIADLSTPAPWGNVTQTKSASASSHPPESNTAHWKIEFQTPNSTELVVSSPSEGFLLWRDGYHPYWKATVDRTAAPVYRANYLFKAVAVPAGVSRVRFDFDPLPVKWAWIAFYVPLSLVLGYELLRFLGRAFVALTSSIRRKLVLRPASQP